MKTKKRWLDWVVSESASLEVQLPWSRAARKVKREDAAVEAVPVRPAAAAAR